MPVEIFKTNVRSKRSAARVLRALHNDFPHLSCNFDLEDCDKILRVESKEPLLNDPLIKKLHALGHQISVLSDEVVL